MYPPFALATFTHERRPLMETGDRHATVAHHALVTSGEQLKNLHGMGGFEILPRQGENIPYTVPGTG